MNTPQILKTPWNNFLLLTVFVGLLLVNIAGI